MSQLEKIFLIDGPTGESTIDFWDALSKGSKNFTPVRTRADDPEFAFHLMAKHSIRNTFLPPTALKLMRQVPDPTRARYPFSLRSIASAGETLGEELFDWGKSALKVEINEFYGQTEFNLMVSNCADVYFR